MNQELIVIVIGFLGTIFTMVSLINQLRTELIGTRTELSGRMDKLETKMDDNFKTLSQKDDDNFKTLLARIDAVNSRLDNLYFELFKKAA